LDVVQKQKASPGGGEAFVPTQLSDRP
jgi:hypothetical protein